MKIAFIGHKRIPSREGGIEIVVDELATRMVDRGHQVIAYNRSGHNVAGSEFDGVANGHGKRFSYHGVNVVSVPTIEGKGLAALSSSFFATCSSLPHPVKTITKISKPARHLLVLFIVHTSPYIHLASYPSVS